MKKNCIWVCGLLLSAFVLLVGYHGSDSPSGALRLSKEVISIAVGQEIALTRIDEGGAVEVMLPKGKDFALTVDSDQIVQIRGKTIKGVAPGKTTVTVTAGAEHALLTVEVQTINKDQRMTLSPTQISTPVDCTIVFGAQEGAGVDVVAATTPATDFTISTSDLDEIKVEGREVTGLAIGTYELAILTNGVKVDFKLIVGDKGLTGASLKSSGHKVLFAPEHLEDVWGRQELLKKMIESSTSYLFDHIDEKYKTIQFIDKNIKAGHMSISYNHIICVLNPKNSERPHFKTIYLGQPSGMSKFTYVGYISDLGFNINQNNPPESQVNQEGNHCFKDVHPTLPYTVRIYYRIRISDEGDKVEDVYARLTLVVRMQRDDRASNSYDGGA